MVERDPFPSSFSLRMSLQPPHVGWELAAMHESIALMLLVGDAFGDSALEQIGAVRAANVECRRHA
jgi:hypothetical protein